VAVVVASVAVESVVVAASARILLPLAAVVVPLAGVVVAVPVAAVSVPVAAVVVSVLAVVLVAAAVVVLSATTSFTGAGAGRYLDGELQNPPKASTTLSLARVKPLARAHAILKTISLFLIASIYLAKVNERATTLPPLSTDVAVTAAEV